MAELIWRGVVYKENAPLRYEGDRLFLATDEPLPVGTRLTVRQGKDDVDWVVTHIRERGETGMELSRVQGDAPGVAIDEEPTVRPTGDEDRPAKKPKRKKN